MSDIKIDEKRLEQNQIKNKQAQDDLDKEFEEIADDDDDLSKEDKKTDLEPKEEEKPEEKEEVEEEEKEEKKPEEKEEAPKEEDKKEPSNKKTRTTKFIPLGKYKKEKDGWKQKNKTATEELEVAKKTITELEKIKAGDESVSKKKAKLQELADKHGTDVSFLEELVDVLDEGKEIKPETIVDKKETDKKPVVEDKTQEDIVKEFDNEFESFMPDLKKQYPNATEEQLSEVKNMMDQFAHAEDFKDYPLSHIMKINQKDFNDVLGKVKDNQGVEGARAGGSGVEEITSNSFKKDANGQYDFAQLHSMDDGPEKDKIVDGMDVDVWDKYTMDLASEEELKVTKKDGTVSLM